MTVRSSLRSVAPRARRLVAEDAVSLWEVALDDPPLPGDDLEAYLSPAERRRAARFLHGRDRRRFVVARGTLRRLLAAELGLTPNAVPIVVDARGKPGLATSELKLSISHSGSVALFALSWDAEVGVDLEVLRQTVDIDRLAARFFTAAEQQALASLPPARRRLAAFRCWVRKEAYAKGTGDGIAAALHGTADVGIGGPRDVGSWSLDDVEAPPGFVAAVAVNRQRTETEWRATG